MISVDENEKLHIYEDRTIEYDFLNYLSGKTGWRYIPCDIYNCSQIITGTRESHNYAVFWWSPISNKINGSDTYKLSLTIEGNTIIPSVNVMSNIVVKDLIERLKSIELQIKEHKIKKKLEMIKDDFI